MLKSQCQVKIPVINNSDSKIVISSLTLIGSIHHLQFITPLESISHTEQKKQNLTLMQDKQHDKDSYRGIKKKISKRRA